MENLSIDQLQNMFDELTGKLKNPLPTDVYNKIWDERVWIKELIGRQLIKEGLSPEEYIP